MRQNGEQVTWLLVLLICSDAACFLKQGVTEASRANYSAAEPAFRQACTLDRALPDACYYWARTLYALDRFEESLTALSLIQGRATWRTQTARGQALDALGRPDAEALLRQALALRSKDPAPLAEPDPRLALSAFFYREGRADDALALLTQAPPAYHKLAGYHYQLGRALAHKGRWLEAAEALRNAVSLRDDYPEAHGLLSRCYHRLGDPDRAAFHTAKARRQGSTTSR